MADCRSHHHPLLTRTSRHSESRARVGLVYQGIGAVDGSHQLQGPAKRGASAPWHDQCRQQTTISGPCAHQEKLALEGTAAARQVGTAERRPPELFPRKVFADLEQFGSLALEHGALETLDTSS